MPVTQLSPVLYFDLGSPYSYLAVERAAGVLGVLPRLEPILVGGIFKLRDAPSWGEGPERAGRIAEIEARAAAYGLPPVAWGPGWPYATLPAMRAAVWADLSGRGDAFARAAFRRAWVQGEVVADPAVLASIAEEVGLPGPAVATAIADPAIKADLRRRTEAAWGLGVRGVPYLRVGDELFYGDDRLEAAARSLAGAR